MKSMNLLKKHNFITKLILLTMVISFIGGQSIIANQKSVDLPKKTGQFEHSILAPNRFQMNQGFTLMTSMGSGINQTTGIYSNFSSYKLSDRLQFNSGIHLIQNQNNLSYSTGTQAGIGYELELEYKLSPNSVIMLQVANYSNSPSPIRYRNLSPFNVP